MPSTCSSISVALLWLLTAYLGVISVVTLCLFVQFLHMRFALPPKKRSNGKRLFQLCCGQYSFAILRNVFYLLAAWSHNQQTAFRVTRTMQGVCLIGSALCVLTAVTEGLKVFHNSIYEIPARKFRWFHVGIAVFPLLFVIVVALNILKPMDNVRFLTSVFIGALAVDFILVYSSLSYAFISRLIALVSKRSALSTPKPDTGKPQTVLQLTTAISNSASTSKFGKTLAVVRRVRSTSVDSFDARSRETLRLVSKHSVLVFAIGLCGVVYLCCTLLATVGFPLRGCVHWRTAASGLMASISMTASCVCTHVSFPHSEKYYDIICAKADSMCRKVAAYRAANGSNASFFLDTELQCGAQLTEIGSD